MDLLDVLGLSRPVADSAVCVELYHDDSTTGDAGASLDALSLRCMQLLQPHLDDYIWQHEPLRLLSSLHQAPPWTLKAAGRKHPHEPAQPQQQQQQQQPPCLWGVVRYEDNVEDEWFVVWLLLELTRRVPGLTARCWDDDGEFLLIEAAYALPRWLKPETATNRIWLRAGELHLVPPPSAKAPMLPPRPSVAEALAVLRSGAVATRRKTVEASILARVSGYPAKARQQLQRVVAWVPRRLGLLLQAEPQLVAAAVSAFMTRQREEVQAAAKFRLLPPTDMTAALVSLNRCMYVQLLQADFGPPKGYPVPPGGDWLGGSSAQQHKAVSFGVKLATGMELMALRLGLTATQPAHAAAHDGSGQPAQCQPQQQQPQQAANGAQQQPATQQGTTAAAGAGAVAADADADAASLAANPAWHTYLSVLQRSGYFDGELEGSARHRQLLGAAQQAFVGSKAHLCSSAALAASKQRLQQLLAAVDAAAAAAGAAADGEGSSGDGAAADAAVPPSGRQRQQQRQRQQSPVGAVLDVPDASQEDGDGWMQAEAEQLQQQLQQAEALAETHASKKQQQQQQPGSRPGEQQQQQDAASAVPPGATSKVLEVDAEQLVAGFRGFVQHEAGPDGAEVPAVTRAAAAAAAAAGGSSGSGSGNSLLQAGGPAAAPAGRGAVPTAGVGAGARFGIDAGELDELDFGADGAAVMSELLNVLLDPGGQPGDMAAVERLRQKMWELQQQLEVRLAQQEAVLAPVGAGELSDDYGSSSSGEASDEGSSFYGSDSDSEEGEAAAAAAAFSQQPQPPLQLQQQQQQQRAEPALLPVRPPVSQRSSQQQLQHDGRQRRGLWRQRLGEWDAITAPDSDDEEEQGEEEEEDDTLALGGSDSDGSGSSGSDGEAASVAPGGGRRRGDAAAAFNDAYGAAMEAELAATTLAQTFERVQLHLPAAAAAVDGGLEAGHPSAAAAGGGQDDAAASLSPLDLDYNLIRSLVASHAAQGGLPGPASNLAGLLGLTLPTELEVDGVQQQQQHQLE